MEKKKSKILLVDDDVYIRQMYAEILNIAGFDTLEANDGLEGFNLAVENVPDIIFTGINMPNMDGFTLMEKLKQNQATAIIPVIISSHMGKESDSLRSKELGARDFIIKNMVTPKEAVDRIKKILLESGVYKIKFDVHALDAPKFLKIMGLENITKCPDCGNDFAFSVTVSDFEDESFSAKLACSNCGWEMK